MKDSRTLLYRVAGPSIELALKSPGWEAASECAAGEATMLLPAWVARARIVP